MIFEYDAGCPFGGAAALYVYVGIAVAARGARVATWVATAMYWCCMKCD